MTTLYSLDKKGKIRVFKGEVGKVTNTLSVVTTWTGLIDGQLTEKQLNITKGKQKRSIHEQAEFEFASLLNEKYNEGYKSEEHLLAKLGEPFTNAGKHFIEDIYKAIGITYNTNKDWLPLCMLADKWKDKKSKVKYPVLVQPKLNGVRCIALYKDGKVLLLSRGGGYYIMPHIQSALLPFFISNPNIQLDGELYNHGMPLQKIVGICTLEDEAQFSRKLPIQYWIYDLAIEKVKQEERFKILSNFTNLCNINPIKVLVTIPTLSEKDVESLHNTCVEQGYEGAIVRDPNAYYQFGFRDSCLLKVKEFQDEEFEIVGCEIDPNKGIESFVFILKNNLISDVEGINLRFKARPTGTLEEKDIWRQNIDKYIGKKATIRFQERTEDGLPHQAHVRHKDSPLLIEAIRDYE
jgi:DNA ligase-1